MDAERFDHLICSLSARAPRRRLLAATTRGLLAALAFTPTVVVGEVKHKHKRRRRRRRKKRTSTTPFTPPPPLTCPIGQKICGTMCVSAGACCPGTSCGAPGCECRQATDDTPVCVNMSVPMLCEQCPVAGCLPDFACVPTQCGDVTAVCFPECVT
jgi:hypothetical protein